MKSLHALQDFVSGDRVYNDPVIPRASRGIQKIAPMPVSLGILRLRAE